MGMDIMKSNGTRCSPILIAGLLIMCLYLLRSWWTLSPQNSELIKQLENLAELLRINGDELNKCSQQKILLDEKLKDSQNKYVQQQIKMEQIKESEDEMKESYQKVQTELQESKKKSESVEKNFKLCHAEMESLKKLGESKDKATETFRSEIVSLKSEIEQKQKQIKELENQLKSANKTGDLLAKDKLMQTLLKNYNACLKKNFPKLVNNKIAKDAVKGYEDQQNEDKFEEGKNYGNSGLLSLDNDPREEEMKES